MNILKKTILFTMPAIMMGCYDEQPKYVITDKGDNKIVYHQVYPVVDTTKHVMIFGQRDNEPEMYGSLSVGDTITGSRPIRALVVNAITFNKYRADFVILTVNGQKGILYQYSFGDEQKRDSLIQQMHGARQK